MSHTEHTADFNAEVQRLGVWQEWNGGSFESEFLEQHPMINLASTELHVFLQEDNLIYYKIVFWGVDSETDSVAIWICPPWMLVLCNIFAI